jgi:predicted metal-dependent hydrolase
MKRTEMLGVPIQGLILQQYAQGVALFNDGKYWDAHEALERVWKVLPGISRLYLQGIIQICGALVHLEDGKMSPARKLMKSGSQKIRDAEAEGVRDLLSPFIEIKNSDQLIKAILTAETIDSAKKRISELKIAAELK